MKPESFFCFPYRQQKKTLRKQVGFKFFETGFSLCVALQTVLEFTL